MSDIRVKSCWTIFKRRLAEAAVRGGCDGLMLENAVCLEEARLQLDGVAGLDLPIILSFEGAMRALDRDLEDIRFPSDSEAEKNGSAVKRKEPLSEEGETQSEIS